MIGELFRTERTDHGERFVPQVEIRPHFAAHHDVPRLARQNTAILNRLREGPATNRQLAEIALNYRARISELRDYLRPRGWDIPEPTRGVGGLNWYRLVKLPGNSHCA